MIKAEISLLMVFFEADYYLSMSYFSMIIPFVRFLGNSFVLQSNY